MCGQVDQVGKRWVGVVGQGLGRWVVGGEARVVGGEARVEVSICSWLIYSFIKPSRAENVQFINISNCTKLSERMVIRKVLSVTKPSPYQVCV